MAVRPGNGTKYYVGIANRDAAVYRQTRYGEMKAAIYEASIDDGRSREDLGMPLMVLGELPMSAWDEYVAKWNKRGGAEVTKCATEW